MTFGGFAPLPLRLGGTAEEGWTAGQHARLCADLSAIVPTVPFAIVRVVGGVTATVSNYLGQHGVGLANAPTVATVSTGITDVTWARRYVDGYSQSEGTFIRHAVACVEGSVARVATCSVSSPEVVRVVTRNTSGTVFHSTWTLVVY